MIISHTSIQASLLAAVLSAGAAFEFPTLCLAAKVEDRIVAIVNSDLIMLSDMKRELAPERERIEKHYRGDERARRL